MTLLSISTNTRRPGKTFYQGETPNEIVCVETTIRHMKKADFKRELDVLRFRLEALQREPTKEELEEYGKIIHPYYAEKDRVLQIESRIKELESLVE